MSIALLVTHDGEHLPLIGGILVLLKAHTAQTVIPMHDCGRIVFTQRVHGFGITLLGLQIGQFGVGVMQHCAVVQRTLDLRRQIVESHHFHGCCGRRNLCLLHELLPFVGHGRVSVDWLFPNLWRVWRRHDGLAVLIRDRWRGFTGRQFARIARLNVLHERSRHLRVNHRLVAVPTHTAQRRFNGCVCVITKARVLLLSHGLPLLVFLQQRGDIRPIVLVLDSL